MGVDIDVPLIVFVDESPVFQSGVPRYVLDAVEGSAAAASRLGDSPPRACSPLRG
jgi:hypothetical protein